MISYAKKRKMMEYQVFPKTAVVLSRKTIPLYVGNKIKTSIFN